MKRIKQNILSILIAFFGLLLVFTPWQLFKICAAVNPSAKSPTGGHMACYYTGKLLVYSGIVLIFFSVLSILTGRRTLKVFLGILTMLIAALDYLLPMKFLQTEILPAGFCGMPNMSCVQHTKPALMVLAPLLFVLGMALPVQSFLSKTERRKG